ncbi:hypothetical protein [Chitinimonas sp. BJYL2]|uniref:hypothetical protein n=1 Tax=Chitinimonas sp. BJYL2 TaxID=2976696 RepID=UPI0022B340F3|nr:hypothetical protein [Chitinimonas sp. BJYL2]
MAKPSRPEEPPRHRLRARADWQDALPVRTVRPAEPVPGWCKPLALLGIGSFWVYFFGWAGEGGREGMETGFALFLLANLPLFWFSLRAQMRRWR